MWVGFRQKIQVSVGAWILLGWFALINGWQLTGEILLAALLHEFGHVVVLKWAGAQIESLRVGMLGAVLEIRAGCMPYGWELAAVSRFTIR